MIGVRRLGPGDEDVLALLARDEADFDLAARGGARPPLETGAAAAYLADAGVLHWVAECRGDVTGHLLCLVQLRRVAPVRQLMLYEVGVRRAWRRRGGGRALLGAMADWMARHEVTDV